MDNERAAGLLQPILVELVNLSLDAKQAHWNVVGPMFRPLHLQLDELTADARQYSDDVAERVVALGQPADGRVTTVAAHARAGALESGFVQDDKVVQAIVERLDAVIAAVRSGIEALDSVDLVSQDLLIGTAAGLEKHRWMFASQKK